MLSIGTKSSNSSSASFDDASEGVVNLLIQQLKVDIFEFHLLTCIEGDAQLGINIQKLLAEVNK